MQTGPPPLARLAPTIYPAPTRNVSAVHSAPRAPDTGRCLAVELVVCTEQPRNAFPVGWLVANEVQPRPLLPASGVLPVGRSSRCLPDMLKKRDHKSAAPAVLCSSASPGQPPLFYTRLDRFHSSFNTNLLICEPHSNRTGCAGRSEKALEFYQREVCECDCEHRRHMMCSLCKSNQRISVCSHQSIACQK